LPSGEEKVRAVTTMFDSIAPRYDLVNRLMTFGLDTGWRKRAIAALGIPEGSLILDIACGTGDFCRELRKARYRAIGFDLSAGMLGRATTTAPLVLADALKLPVGDRGADGVTCGFALRNVRALNELFLEFARVIRPGGRAALLEVAEPDSRIIRVGHHFYFHRITPLIGGLLSDKGAYSYLPRSVQYLPDVKAMLAMLESAGFHNAVRKPLMFGAAQLITATRN